jgi:transcriptional regulator with XRE-family HTH domain
MPVRAIVMSKQPYSFVRAYRRRWGLTQAELAQLLGITASTSVSRMERSMRQPTSSILIACSILFGVPATELFAWMYESAEEAVAAAAKDLCDALEGETGERARRKREFLKAVLVRVESPNSPEV